MKFNAIFITGLMLMTQTALAASLRISGTVPDRGFTIKFNAETQMLVPLENSDLKIFVSEKAIGLRKWKKLTRVLTLSQASHVRVEAP